MKNIHKNNIFVIHNPCRFGNQLFDIFKTYLYNEIDSSRNYIGSTFKHYEWNRYNLDKYVNYTDKHVFHRNWLEFRLPVMFPNILEKFINEHFLQNYNNEKITNKFLFQIRNTDFIDYNDAIINRNEIFNLYIDYIYKNFPNINTIDILSDDIDYCIKNYTSILTKYNHKINYLKQKSLYDDFELSWRYNHKMIMNSTFHLWGCYISNVLFNYNCHIITYSDKKMNYLCYPKNSIIIRYL